MTPSPWPAGSCPGRCMLVGAGPGDPELLTLKALKAIRLATVLLVDDLVGDDVLALALADHPAPPRIVAVGKRGGCASTPQAFIERLMIQQAWQGECVVRLKGGDPFVFGRGGEEAEHLRAAGVPVEVVGGLTAGLAAATALGTPLTHRELARGVMFVTGHARDGGEEPDWDAIAAAARAGITLVVYMGVARIEAVQQGLRSALPDRTPAAVVQHASLPQQRSVLTTLGELPQAVRREGLGSPAIVIIGEVLQGLASLAADTPLAAPQDAAAATA